MLNNKLVNSCLAFTMLLPSSGLADGRRFVQRSTSCNHHVQQQIVEYPHIVQEQVYYFVGQPLRIESLLRLERQQYTEQSDDRLQQEFKEFQAWKQKQAYKSALPQNSNSDSCPNCKNHPTNSESPPETPIPPETSENTDRPDNPAPTNQTSLFVQKCGKCHSGATPKGQLTLSTDTTMNLAMFKKCVAMIDSGKMPKGGPPLSANDADQIKSELLQLTQ